MAEAPKRKYVKLSEMTPEERKRHRNKQTNKARDAWLARRKEKESESRIKKAITGLDEDGKPVFEVTRESVLALYEKTFKMMRDEGIDEEDDEAETKWSPAPEVVTCVLKYFEDNPFDKIKWGLLKIEDKKGDYIPFVMNDEQKEVFKDLEYCWHNKLEFNAITLKARQIGMSTFIQLVNYCLLSTQGRKRSFVVADIAENAKGFMEKLEAARLSEPWWMRPKKTLSEPLNYKGKNIATTRCKIGSAERRDKLGRSITCQFVHLSEIAFWPPSDAASIVSSVMKIIPREFPRVWFEESTGKFVNDLFYNRCFQAKNGNLDGFHYYFFPWFKHKEYALPLRGISKQDFLDFMAEEDKKLMESYNLSVEQMNWYISTRSQELLKDDMTPDLFKREYPSNEQEAFLGLNSNYFDVGRQKTDYQRLYNQKQQPVSMHDLPESCSTEEQSGREIVHARCTVFADEAHNCRDAKMIDDMLGLWRVFEMPRRGHKYVISSDIARGIQTDKRIANSTDYSVIDVWRVTYGRKDMPKFTQVAQLRQRGIDPFVLAEQATAMSVIYGDRLNGVRCLIIGEANSHGLAFVERCKDLGAYQYQRKTYGSNRELISIQLGFTTTAGLNAQGAKSLLLSKFSRTWKNDMVHIMSRFTCEEMGTFANINGKLEAIPPNHDDTVMTAALAMEGVEYLLGDITPEKCFELDNDDDREERGDIKEFDENEWRRRYGIPVHDENDEAEDNYYDDVEVFLY